MTPQPSAHEQPPPDWAAGPPPGREWVPEWGCPPLWEVPQARRWAALTAECGSAILDAGWTPHTHRAAVPDGTGAWPVLRKVSRPTSPYGGFEPCASTLEQRCLIYPDLSETARVAHQHLIHAAGTSLLRVLWAPQVPAPSGMPPPPPPHWGEDGEAKPDAAGGREWSYYGCPPLAEVFLPVYLRICYMLPNETGSGMQYRRALHRATPACATMPEHASLQCSGEENQKQTDFACGPWSCCRCRACSRMRRCLTLHEQESPHTRATSMTPAQCCCIHPCCHSCCAQLNVQKM